MIVLPVSSRVWARMMIVQNRFSVSCFPPKSAALFKIAAISSSRGSAAASEIRVIQDDNHDQDNIEKAAEESVNSQEGNKGNAARWSNTE